MNKNNGFTNNKDVDRKILLMFDLDEDIKKLCSINKYFHSICDENFFHNRIISKHSDLIYLKRASLSWKEFFYRIQKEHFLAETHFEVNKGGNDISISTWGEKRCDV